MENLNDIFNLSLDDFKEPERKQSLIFKPDSKSGKDGVYKAVVRFIPWHKDAKKSVMKKWSCWLVDPANNEGKMVDCPSTVGKKSIIQDFYWKFKKSDSVAEQKLAENFSRRQRFASLVQIIKDDNNPEMVGKIMVWPYGVKIYNKLQAEMKPEFGKPHIPFDLFEGKPFLVHITQVAGYNNYDNCRFLDEKMPLTIDGEKMEKTQECFNKIKSYLDESPDLSAYDYQDWDQATEDFVNQVIRNTVPGGRMIESVEKNNRKTTSAISESNDDFVLPSAPTKPKPAAVETSSILDDSDDFDPNSFDDDLYASL
ncbi:MAG: Synechococcus phage [Bacteroidota bacterium]|jgi:hypothetical protein